MPYSGDAALNAREQPPRRWRGRCAPPRTCPRHRSTHRSGRRGGPRPPWRTHRFQRALPSLTSFRSAQPNLQQSLPLFPLRLPFVVCPGRHVVPIGRGAGVQAQSGDAPRSFDRRRPPTKEMSTTVPVESSRVRRWRRLAARNLVRTIAEGFPGKQRTRQGSTSTGRLAGSPQTRSARRRRPAQTRTGRRRRSAEILRARGARRRAETCEREAAPACWGEQTEADRTEASEDHHVRSARARWGKRPELN